jgi:hypothetical protein
MKKYFLIFAIIIIMGLSLVVVISYISKPTPRKPKLTIEEQVAAVQIDLKILELTLGDYYATHNTFADTLTSLTTPIGYFGTRPVAFIDTIPVDPFNLDRRPVGKGQNPYKYIKQGEGEKAEALLYSYGPDTNDDNGSVVYDPQNGTKSNGDIILHASPPAEDALKGAAGHSYAFENEQIARALDDNGIKDFMWALKAARYDLRATTDSAAMEAAKSVMRDGWHGELTTLEASLERNQQAFSLIHEGAKKPFAKSVIREQELTFASAFPNFLSMQVLTKLMICQGKKFEAEGEPQKAIRNYLDTAKFGQSVGNGMLIGKLIDIAMESMAYKALQKALLNSQFERTYLEALLEELAKLEQSTPPLATSFWYEHLTFIHFIEQAGISKRLKKTDPMWRRLPSSLLFGFAKKKIIESNTKFWSEVIDYAKRPYPEAVTFDMDSRIKTADPLTKIATPNFFEALTRDTVAKAYMQAARIMAALELFKRDNNAYPGTIDELSPIPHPSPLDPFTEKNFRYEKVRDAYRLYSAGPDMYDDSATIIYDPTNGVQSAGDIIFRE